MGRDPWESSDPWALIDSEDAAAVDAQRRRPRPAPPHAGSDPFEGMLASMADAAPDLTTPEDGYHQAHVQVLSEVVAELREMNVWLGRVAKLLRGRDDE